MDLITLRKSEADAPEIPHFAWRTAPFGMTPGWDFKFRSLWSNVFTRC